MGASKWVLPGRIPNNHVDIKTVSKHVGDRQVKFKSRTRKLKNRVEDNSLVLGNEDWTPHDLRRTGATMMQRGWMPVAYGLLPCASNVDRLPWQGNFDKFFFTTLVRAAPDSQHREQNHMSLVAGLNIYTQDR